MSATNNDSLTATPLSINSVLRQLESLVHNPSQEVPSGFAREIGVAISQIFNNQLSPVQSALLLHDLYFTKLEQHPEVLKECARVMTDAAQLPDAESLKRVVKSRALGHAGYNGGLVW